MDDFIFLPDPLILRGLSLDQQTQVGFYGTPLQVLHQQGYTVGEQSLRLVHLSNPLRELIRICDGSDRDCRKRPCSVCRSDNCPDEGIDGDMTNVDLGHLDGDK